MMIFSKSKALQETSHALIPGGCHTYAKGDDQFPESAPAFIARGEGCHVWDVDGNEFIEYGMGLRAVTLGHAFKPVIDAACRQIQLGQNFTRAAPVEVECAETLLDLIPAGDMVKFTKDGSTATSAAVRLARACTGRDMVAICSDHPFISYNDWFIGVSPMPAGIPAAVRDLTIKFDYNNIASLQAAFDRHSGKIACVIMEAEKNQPPADDFLHKVQAMCRKNGALFILDEMITGFRWHLGGAQQYHGLDPDLSSFGKAIANGFALSALVGKKEFMIRGGYEHDKERVFLLSTTHGAETGALAAGIATMNVYRDQQVVEILYKQGKRLADGINRAISEHQLEGYFGLLGKPCNLVYSTKDENKKDSQPFRTLFLQETIKRGLILPSLVISFAHTDADIDRSVEAIAEALLVYKKALSDGIEKYLIGRPIKPAIRARA